MWLVDNIFSLSSLNPTNKNFLGPWFVWDPSLLKGGMFKRWTEFSIFPRNSHYKIKVNKVKLVQMYLRIHGYLAFMGTVICIVLTGPWGRCDDDVSFRKTSLRHCYSHLGGYFNQIWNINHNELCQFEFVVEITNLLWFVTMVKVTWDQRHLLVIVVNNVGKRRYITNVSSLLHVPTLGNKERAVQCQVDTVMSWG